MLTEIFAAVEQWPLAAALRGSTWAYPLVNAAHVIGIALLFGAIVPLDLRLAGLWPRLSVSALRRALLPVALAGLGLAAAAGALLFICKARDYAASPLFQAKIATVALALLNAAALEITWRRRTKRERSDTPNGWPRLAGLASIGLWLTVIVLGRLVGYF